VRVKTRSGAQLSGAEADSGQKFSGFFA